MNLPANRRSLATDLFEMNRLMNRVFNDDFDADLELATTGWMPSVDIEETDKGYMIKAELPDVKKDDVKITCEEGVLTLAGERRKETEEKGKRFHRVERTFGTFARSFRLPLDVDKNKIDAKFEDGVLSVTLPKSATPSKDAHQIKIH